MNPDIRGAYLPMQVDRANVVELIELSVSRGTSLPSPPDIDRELWIARAKEDLLSWVIDPLPATVTSAVHEGDQFAWFLNAEVYAVANANHHYLLYHPRRQLFAQAWGNLDDLTMLGYASGDALAEWRG